MSNGAIAGAAAAHAAKMNAVRSFGVICTVEVDEFMVIVGKQDQPLVVTSSGGIFSTEYRYLVSHKGFAFFTKSAYPLELPRGTFVVQAKTMLLPG